MGLTVSIISIASLTAFDLSQQVNSNPDISLTVEGENLTVVSTDNVDKLKVDETVVEDNVSVGDQIDPSSADGSTAGIVAVTDGNEQLVRQVDLSTFSDSQTEDSASGSSETVSGTVKVNPKISGATVTAIAASGSEIATDTTGPNGGYDLGVSPSQFESVAVSVKAADELANPLYASSIKPASSSTVNIDFNEDNLFNKSINGTQVSIIYEKNTADERLVGNVHQLQALNNSQSADYVLISDIDATQTANWNGGNGFSPVGPTFSTAFSGSLDGQGHTIDGLTINRTADNIGLFGHTTTSATLTNLKFTNADIKGESNIGTLVGTSSATIRTVSAETTVNSTEFEVGGLVGRSDGSVLDSSVSGTVTGDSEVGGLVGTSNGTVSDSSASGSVTGITSPNDVAGLVGNNVDGTVENSSASARVTAVEGFGVGGLVGDTDGGSTVSNSSATGDVTGDDDVGGLVGGNRGTVLNSFAIGNVRVDSAGNSFAAGGLVGESDEGSTVENSFATGNVTGEDDVGGLVGEVESGSRVTNASANGSVTGDDKVGGLVGLHEGGTVSDGFATGDVTVTNAGNPVGGLVGLNEDDRDGNGATLRESYFDNSGTGTTQATAVGSNTGTSTVGSEVTGLTTSQVGGELPEVILAGAGVSVSQGPSDTEFVVKLTSFENADNVTVRADGSEAATLTTVGETVTVSANEDITAVGFSDGTEFVVNSIDPNQTILTNTKFTDGLNGYTSSRFSTTSTGNSIKGGVVAVSENQGEHNSQASVERTFTLNNSRTVEIRWKVSSESNFDFGRIFIDGTEEAEIDGEVAYRTDSFDVSSGQHTVEVRYSKDGSVSNNDDEVRIDYIELTE